MLKAFIVDDEPQSRNFLGSTLARNFPEVSVVGQSATVDDAIAGIKKHGPDIVFLDVQMDGETGFDLLTRLPEINFSLVFTSAFDRFAIKAFRFNAVDYLLKPIIVEELAEALDKIKRPPGQKQVVSKRQVEQLSQDIKNPQKPHENIAIPTADGFLMMRVADIVYCRANGNYTEFMMTGKKCILSSYTLKQYDELLTPQYFFRAHRSYLINLAHVSQYKRSEGGIIKMSNGDELELARAHKEEFMHLLNIRM